MNSKLQDVLHWILVIVLWVMSITPAVVGLVAQHLTGSQLIIAASGTLVAIATKFVYYADTVQGVTIPTVPGTNVTASITTPPTNTTNS